MLIILVADGARPDSLTAAIDAGSLPALARMRAEGAAHTVTSTFPSVTGPAYAPFLMGRFPGPIGLPALRWFDRSRSDTSFPHFTRSYVGHEMRYVDRDIDAASPTMFELAPRSLGSLSVIQRGLAKQSRLGRGARFALRAARTHFSGDARGWLDIDRELGRELARRVRDERPEFVFAAFTGIDKMSHAEGHDDGLVVDAMRIVDGVAAELRDDAERAGRWEETHLWIVSDHGHSPVSRHENLAGLIEESGHRVIAHPWIFRAHPDVAVMVSGNAMAHIYLDLDATDRPWWPALRSRWGTLADMVVSRPSVDLALLPHSPTRCEVVSATRGRAIVELVRTADGQPRYSCSTIDGDPLGIGAPLAGASAAEAWEATVATDYPDSVVQIAHLAGASRSGEIMLSATREWDFRARYEPIPHRSSHGALHREHMLVPLLLNQVPARAPRRTVDVMPSALTVLGITERPPVDGQSFF
ncbi:MAG: alkaline phosphatase family protein [Gemmatimonadaceae bacterium]